METYKRILVPLDGSEFSETVLPEIEKLASALKANVSILRVAYAHRILGIDPIKHEANIVREAEDYVQSVEQRLISKGLMVDNHVRYGPDAAEEILNHVTDYNIDLIVMCTHGFSGVRRLVLGSVTEKVLRQATKPVLLVQPPA